VTPSPTSFQRELLLATARHLPPSPSTLQLVDVGGLAAEVLAALRPDIAALPVAADAESWPLAEASADAVITLDTALSADFLRQALAVLRPGGRLIAVASEGHARANIVQTLEAAGFVRILVEPALDAHIGLLMRGEKPHQTEDTLARVEQVARRDAALTSFATYPGRYVYLLVRQMPNKPVWAMRPDEAIRWQAAALDHANRPVLLAFSGLPKAVSFMQPAVLSGQIAGVNKVAKFSRATAQSWTLEALLNPPADILDEATVHFIEIDPTSAEASDE
jgi:SAM-dependent methyltransferase